MDTWRVSAEFLFTYRTKLTEGGLVGRVASTSKARQNLTLHRILFIDVPQCLFHPYIPCVFPPVFPISLPWQRKQIMASLPPLRSVKPIYAKYLPGRSWGISYSKPLVKMLTNLYLPSNIPSTPTNPRATVEVFTSKIVDNCAGGHRGEGACRAFRHARYLK